MENKVIQTERLFLREMNEDDYDALYRVLANSDIMQHYIGGVIKPEIGYHIRADKQRKGYVKEAAIAVRDRTFENTPFREIYSYMKYTNEPSARTAMSYGCRQVDEFEDEENGITKVFMVSKDEWRLKSK